MNIQLERVEAEGKRQSDERENLLVSNINKVTSEQEMIKKRIEELEERLSQISAQVGQVANEAKGNEER